MSVSVWLNTHKEEDEEERESDGTVFPAAQAREPNGMNQWMGKRAELAVYTCSH